MRQNYSKTWLLAFTSFLLGTTPAFSQTYQGGIKKQKNLAHQSIQERVRRNLAEGLDDENGIRNLFALGDEAVPSLIRFLSDSDKERRAGAARGLAYIGDQQGTRALRKAVNSERDRETKLAMSCFLAGGMIETTSESDLAFLKGLAEKARFVDDDEYESPAFCAALALGMMGRNDSVSILRKAAAGALLDSEEIAKAVKWMENKPIPAQVAAGPPLSDQELIKRTVLERTFFAQEERDETSLTQFTFSPGHGRALVSLAIYHGPRSARGYDLVLVKEKGVWRVAGIWFEWIA